MEVVTLRLPEELVDELDAEAEAKGFTSRAEYVRVLLRNRSEYAPVGTGTGPNTDVIAGGSSTPEPPGSHAEERPAPAADPATPSIDDVLAGWRPGTSAADRRDRVDAGRQVLEWLREQHGPREKAEFVDALYPELQIDDEQGEYGWWEYVAREALQRGADAGIVEYRPGHYDYEWGVE